MRRWPLGVALVPAIALAAFVWRFGVDVPYWDQWELVPLLKGAHDGTLRAADFFALHNEHRLVVPRLIMLGLAMATRWRIGAELAVSIALAGALAATLARRLDGARWALPIVSLIVFSLGQRENWLWGWQIQIFASVAAAAGAVVLLSGDSRAGGRVAQAFALGAASSFSFANGLLCWPIGLAMLLARRRWLAALAWSIGAAAILAIYFHGYATPPHDAIASSARARALDVGVYVLAYLGAPLAGFGVRAAALAGAGGLIAFAWLAARAVRERGIKGILAPGALASYAVGSAVLTAFGRSGFGAGQALASRYTTISNLLWLAIVLAAAPAARRVRSWPALACALIAALSLHESVRGAILGARQSRFRAALRQSLVEGRGELAPYLYPNVGLLKERAAWLEAQRLSVYRDLK